MGNMDWITIGITLLLGGTITYLLQLLFQKKSRLSIVYSPDVQLIDTIAKLSPDFVIKYKNEPASEYLTAVIFSIYNSGKKDVELSEKSPPLELTLPENVEWKDLKVVQKSEGVSGGVKFATGRTVGIKWDLLRVNEFITFLGFVDNSKQNPETDDELTDSSELFPKGVMKKLILSDRIPDTTIDKKEIDLRSKEPHLLVGLLLFTILGLAMVITSLYQEYSLTVKYEHYNWFDDSVPIVNIIAFSLMTIVACIGCQHEIKNRRIRKKIASKLS